MWSVRAREGFVLPEAATCVATTIQAWITSADAHVIGGVRLCGGYSAGNACHAQHRLDANELASRLGGLGRSTVLQLPGVDGLPPGQADRAGLPGTDRVVQGARGDRRLVKSAGSQVSEYRGNGLLRADLVGSDDS